MQIRGSLTPPGMRALKRKVLTQFKYESRCRTPPGVHALKRRLNRHYRARKRGASRDKDIPLFDLMELFIIGINEHNSPFFSLLAFFTQRFRNSVNYFTFSTSPFSNSILIERSCYKNYTPQYLLRRLQ